MDTHEYTYDHRCVRLVDGQPCYRGREDPVHGAADWDHEGMPLIYECCGRSVPGKWHERMIVCPSFVLMVLVIGAVFAALMLVML